MAKVEYGRVTVISTGNKIYSLNDATLTPDEIVLFIATATDEVSAGYSNVTNNFTGSSKYSDENLTYSITHYRNISGVKTKTFEATVTSLVAGDIYINVTTCTQNTVLNFVSVEY